MRPSYLLNLLTFIIMHMCNISAYVISQPADIYCIRNDGTMDVPKVRGSKREAKTRITMMSRSTTTVYSDQAIGVRLRPPSEYTHSRSVYNNSSKVENQFLAVLWICRCIHSANSQHAHSINISGFTPFTYIQCKCCCLASINMFYMVSPHYFCQILLQ